MTHRALTLVGLASLLLLAGATVGDVDFGADRTRAEVGRTRAIVYAITSEDGRDLAPSIEDEDVLALVAAPAPAPGSTHGYLRVRGLRSGATALRLGDARIEVEVVPPVVHDGAQHAPRIVGPVTSAAAWGTISVLVEVRPRDDRPLRRIELRGPHGMRVDPVEDSGDALVPLRAVRFEVDASAHAPGALDLVPVAIDDAGDEQRGDAVRVRCAVVPPEDRRRVEAEAPIDVERPQRFRDARMSVGRDDRASGGAYFANHAAQPAVCVPLEVERAGWYQLALTAAGSRAGGALPTVGIVVDDDDRSTTNAPIHSTDWHRIAAGVPIRLEAGAHVLTPFFANDFYAAGLADRNLKLDVIEIARVADADGAGGAGAGMMAGGGAMMGMAMDMGMGGAGADEVVEVDDPLGRRAVPLRIAFSQSYDGAIAPGIMEITGRAWWAGLEASRPAPRVTLLVNGAPTLEQRTAAPRFWLAPHHLEPGANTIRLEARLDDGTVARTPEQRLEWPGAPDGAEPEPRDFHRFSVHDERWSDDVRERFGSAHNPDERVSAVFTSNGAARLALPEDLDGAFDLFLEARGDAFEGAPRLAVTLETADGAVDVGAVDVPGWWATLRVDPVTVAPGPKTLVVAFTNDRFEPERGDRNAFLQAAILIEQPAGVDRRPPWIEIAYPPDGHEAYGADAVVVEVSDDRSLRSVELLVDGRRTGLAVDLNGKPGRAVLPMLLRDDAPGAHVVEAVATDASGNTTRSAPRAITVLAEEPAAPGPYRRAVRILNRFAYGPDPEALADALVEGARPWLAERLARPFDAGDRAALGGALARFPNRSPYETSIRAVDHLIATPNPARARFVLWAENHFSTWIRKVQGERKWTEHATFTELGVAPFDRLLAASAESPAMLAYLDQESSYAGRINENYAREIMELHTLGVDGGYDQEDVTRLARLLTGWTASFEGDGRGGGPGAQRYAFRFDPALNDGGANEVVGLALDSAAPSDRHDRVRFALEALAAHPSTARFVTGKLAAHYIGPGVDDAVVDDLAVVFLETGGDLRAVLLAIADHPAFWSSPPRMTHPIDAVARLFRVTGHRQPWQAVSFLQRSGCALFDRPTPDGYPEEDDAYADSNAMVQRWRLAQATEWPITTLVPGAWRSANVDAARWRQAIVDIIAVRLTGDLLSPRSNDAALALLAESEASRQEQVRFIGPFIAQLPEAQMR